MHPNLNPNRLALHWQILIALALALCAGALGGADAALFGVPLHAIYDFVGTLFLNALKMIALPLVATSLICGMAELGGGRELGRLGGKALAFYAASSLLAILVGLVAVNAIAPGLLDGEPAGEALNLGVDSAERERAVERVGGRGSGDVVDVFLRMVPPNIVDAAAEGQLLGVIFFSLLLGFFIARVEREEYRAAVFGFWRGSADAVLRMTMWIIRFAPIGVFALVAETVALTGFAAFVPLLKFFAAVVLALAAHACVTMPLALRFIGAVSPLRHARAVAPALLTAFSTASSSGTLPLTMHCVRENAGVSNRTSSFVLPLGATVNMDGTALYECVAAMFIAQAYGLELGFGTQFLIVLTALLTSIGVAGIPAASLVAISIILTAVGLPLEGIGLLLITDRVLDMMRTTVNVFGDTCATVIVARLNGETTALVDGAPAARPA